MKVTQLAELLGAKVVCPADREIACGYSCDLLSWVMAHGKQDMAWVTVQAHLNVIAMAVLADMSCVIAAEGVKFPPDAVAKAQSEDLALLECDKSAYEICSIMARAGIQ